MFLGEQVFNELLAIRTDTSEIMRFASLEADLAVFAQSPSLDPRYLYKLAPRRDCVWEIRSTRPEPQLRVLGLFAAQDVFIATNIAVRNALGKFDSREWRTAKRTAGAVWNGLFHPYQPLNGTDVHQMVSGAISGKYFKDFRAH